MTANRNFDNSGANKPKTKLIILGVFTIAILVFWTLQMQANIKGPFQLGSEYSTLSKKNSNNIGTCTGPDCLSDTELRNKDTDKDGLSDWEELNIYGTSPYLADSDSDSISDSEEIEAGTDPNCAEGSSCDVNENSSGIDINIEEELNNISDNISVPEEDEKRLEEALSGDMDADNLRTLMIESGVEKDLVESFSDEELMALYQETLTQQEQQ
ncbi:hypothetical protein K9M50_02095 [Patescibacteria group bacterium]|nr:hypothetical protein [Patescibacteria group bacterium]